MITKYYLINFIPFLEEKTLIAIFNTENIIDINGEVVAQYIYTLSAAGERLSDTELSRTNWCTYADYH